MASFRGQTGKWLAGTALALSMVGASCGTQTSTIEVSAPTIVSADEAPVPGLGQGTTDNLPPVVAGEPTELVPTEPTQDPAPAPSDEAASEQSSSDGDGGGFSLPPIVTEGSDSTPLNFAMIKENLAESVSYRYDFSFAMEMGPISMPATPLATGSFDSGINYLLMDLGPMMSAAGGLGGAEMEQIFGSDLTMEMIVGDGTRVYLRSPMLGSLAALGSQSGDTSLAGLEVLADSWGYIDAASMGLSPEEVAQLAGAQSVGPDQILVLLEDAGVGIEDLGSATIRGVETRHLRGDVTLGAMLEAQGQDLGIPMKDSMMDLSMPFDIWVDADNQVRRVVMSMDLQAIAAAAGEPADMAGSMEAIYEFYDYGASDIDVQIPSGAVDVGSALLALEG